MITIASRAPKFDIDAPNFTRAMGDAGHCRSWFTMDEPDIVLTAEGTLSSVSGRLGEATLFPAPFATPPRLGIMHGEMAGLIHERDRLDHVFFECPWLETTQFAIASIAMAEASVNRPQNLASVSCGPRNLRVIYDGSSLTVKENGVDVCNIADVATKGAFLAVLSASNGAVRLMMCRDNGQIATAEAERTVDIGSPIRVVLGADQIAEEPDRPTPSPPRSWRGAFFDALAFDRDILDGNHDRQMNLLLQYFNRVYGASA